MTYLALLLVLICLRGSKNLQIKSYANSVLLDVPFFHHAVPGVADAVHDNEGIGIDPLYFGSEAVDLQPGDDGENNVGGIGALAPLAVAPLALVDGHSLLHFFLDH